MKSLQNKTLSIYLKPNFILRKIHKRKTLYVNIINIIIKRKKNWKNSHKIVKTNAKILIIIIAITIMIQRIKEFLLDHKLQLNLYLDTLHQN